MNSEASRVEEMMPKAGTPFLLSFPNASGNKPSLAAASGISAQIIDQRGHQVAGPGTAEDAVDRRRERRGGLAELGAGDDAEHRDQRQQVDDGGAEGAEDRGPGDVLLRVADLRRRDRCGLDPEVGEQ